MCNATFSPTNSSALSDLKFGPRISSVPYWQPVRYGERCHLIAEAVRIEHHSRIFTRSSSSSWRTRISFILITLDASGPAYPPPHLVVPPYEDASVEIWRSSNDSQPKSSQSSLLFASRSMNICCPTLQP